MAIQHCNQVADLHINYLPTKFRSTPGLKLLRLYYQALIQSQGGCGYVFEVDGQIQGYICGVWDRQSLGLYLISKHTYYLIYWGMRQILTQPRFSTEILKRLKELRKHINKNESGVELRPIVVAPQVRGSGVAERLVISLIEAAAQLGFKRIYLFTEQDNIGAQRFYSKVGFQKIDSVVKGGMIYLQYEYLIKGNE